VTKFVLKNIGALPYDKDNGYVVRFRVLSQDRNRMSAWSPFYVVPIPTDLQIDDPVTPPSDLTAYSINLAGNNRLVNVMWTDKDNALLGLTSLDVYTKQASGSWDYIGRMGINNGSNLVQRVFSITGGASITFSFHRPLKVPDRTSPPANTRLFQVSTTIS